LAAGGLIADPAATIDEQFAVAEQALAELRDSKPLKLATVGGFFAFLVPLAVLAAVPSLFVEEKRLRTRRCPRVATAVHSTFAPISARLRIFASSLSRPRWIPAFTT